MSKSDRYRARLTLNGNSQREREVNLLKKDITRKALSSASCKDVKINGEDRKLIINTGTLPNYKTYCTLPGETMSAGDYVDFANKKWIVIDADSDDEIYVDGNLRECAWCLKWQNKNSEIISRWAYVISASKYNNGENDKTNYIIGTDQLLLTIPKDEETLKLTRENRFFIDYNKSSPKTYKLTNISTVTSGCIDIIVTECQFNQLTDNVEEMICDYVSDTSVPGTEGELSPTITYTSDFIKSGGSSKKFYAKFLDENGINIEETQPIWKIDCDFKDELIVQENDNFISISIDNDDCIGEYFELILTCEGSSKKDVLSIEVREF